MLSYPKIGDFVQVRYSKKKWPVRPPLQHKHGLVVIVGRGRPRNHGVMIAGEIYVVPFGHLFLVKRP